MNKIITNLLGATLLWFTGSAGAAPIPIDDGFYDIFDPALVDDYEPNVVLGGPAI